MDGTEMSAWEEIGGRRAVATAEPSMQLSVFSRMADITDLAPVSRAEFIAELTPCLELVAPVGMDEDSRYTWFNAAARALDGIPIALLKRGAAAAMAKADHPSKIVPAIMAEVSKDWDWRRRHASHCPPPAFEQPAREIGEEERAEVAALMDGLVRKLSANS